MVERQGAIVPLFDVEHDVVHPERRELERRRRGSGLRVTVVPPQLTHRARGRCARRARLGVVRFEVKLPLEHVRRARHDETRGGERGEREGDPVTALARDRPRRSGWLRRERDVEREWLVPFLHQVRHLTAVGVEDAQIVRAMRVREDRGVEEDRGQPALRRLDASRVREARALERGPFEGILLRRLHGVRRRFRPHVAPRRPLRRA